MRRVVGEPPKTVHIGDHVVHPSQWLYVVHVVYWCTPASSNEDGLSGRIGGVCWCVIWCDCLCLQRKFGRQCRSLVTRVFGGKRQSLLGKNNNKYESVAMRHLRDRRRRKLDALPFSPLPQRQWDKPRPQCHRLRIRASDTSTTKPRTKCVFKVPHYVGFGLMLEHVCGRNVTTHKVPFQRLKNEAISGSPRHCSDSCGYVEFAYNELG